MVPRRESMAVCRAVVSKLQGPWRIQQCQCSSVYVPCSLVVSPLLYQRAGNPAKGKHRKLPFCPVKCIFFPSTFWFQNRSWKEFWDSMKLWDSGQDLRPLESWPWRFWSSACPHWVVLIREISLLSTLNYSWEQSQMATKLQDAFLSELSSSLSADSAWKDLCPSP